jgi:hypothetical protein
MRKLLVLLVGAASAAACAPEVNYAFRPAEQATAMVAGRPAARYGIPPESPRGSARVASFGITKVETSTGTVPTLHVRLTIANNNDTGPWELDARSLRVAYESGAESGPMFINTRTMGEHEISIEPGESAVVDAYFPLPPGAESAAGVPRFDMLWEVSTPEREVAERTPFERIRIEPEAPPVSAGFALGMGPMWWYDPLYFPGPPIVLRPPPRVYIITPPRR